MKIPRTSVFTLKEGATLAILPIKKMLLCRNFVRARVMSVKVYIFRKEFTHP